MGTGATCPSAGEAASGDATTDEAIPCDPAGATPAYSVYMVRCADGSLYAGIAIDVVRRIAEHNGGGAVNGVGRARGRGARYTSARRPVTLVYQWCCGSRSAAMREEARIKRLTRVAKHRLIATAKGGRTGVAQTSAKPAASAD